MELPHDLLIVLLSTQFQDILTADPAHTWCTTDMHTFMRGFLTGHDAVLQPFQHRCGCQPRQSLAGPETGGATACCLLHSILQLGLQAVGSGMKLLESCT